MGGASMFPSYYGLSFSSFLLLPLLLFLSLPRCCSGLAAVAGSGGGSNQLALPNSVLDTIQQGKIAVVDDFLAPSTVSRLRRDAQALYYSNDHGGSYIADAIAGYGKSANQKDKAQFDASKDRSVCPAYIPSQKALGPFVDSNLGDSSARIEDLMNTRIAALRRELAIGLDRPGMDALPDDLFYNHEISYTRFGPGAYLKRHTDEHHEELKGTRGWSTPTRRSLSWLIYLNEPDWDATKDGGNLRTYPREADSIATVGSRPGGDLQIGWFRATIRDPVERPVFLDAQRQGESGNCALYIDSGSSSSSTTSRIYVTKDFLADPYLFLSTDWVVQHMLIQQNYKDAEWVSRFQYVESPKSIVTEYWDGLVQQKQQYVHRPGETILDVAPIGGRLVMFDSVTLPHQVLATLERERWAVSGWFHEAQQDIPLRQQLFLNNMK